jgi:O-antigen/teichoic acid export membrane protein
MGVAVPSGYTESRGLVGSPAGAADGFRRETRTLTRESLALWLNSLLTAVFGLGFWFVAGRRYSAEDVGRDGTLVNALMPLSAIAQFNLGAALTYLLPASARPGRVVGKVYAVACAASLVAGGVFVVGAPLLSDTFLFLRERPALVVTFVVSTMVWSLFSLQDAAFVGLERAALVPVDNVLFGAIKLLLAVLLVSSTHGLFVSWVLGAAIMVVPGSAALVALTKPRHHGARLGGGLVPGRAFLGLDWLGAMLGVATFGGLSIVVLVTLGTEAAAVYTIVYAIGAAHQSAGIAVGTALTVQGARTPAALPTLLRTGQQRLLKLVLPAAVALCVLGPIALRELKPVYADRGSIPLFLFVVAVSMGSFSELALALARVTHDASFIVRFRIVRFAGILAGGWLAASQFGLNGVGVAVLVSEAIGLAMSYAYLQRSRIRADAYLLRTERRRLQPETP